MKTVSSPRPWPPEVCAEVREHLSRYRWSSRPQIAVDDLHGILAELDGWLGDRRPYQNHRRTEWTSLIDDVDAAFDLVGGNLASLLPSTQTLRAGLHPGLGPDAPARAALRPVLAQVRTEAHHADAPIAAFDDIVDAVTNQDTRSDVIAGRVDILDSVLRFADRSLSSVIATVSGILDNDTWHVGAIRHQLDGEPEPDVEAARANPDAGLSVAERFALARRWIGRPPVPGHHVVWLFYGNARQGAWRLPIGPCEFFDGPRLLAQFGDLQQTRAAGDAYPGNRPLSLPPELLLEGVAGQHLRSAESWPKHERWVAARVDLGMGTFADAVQTARDQAEALVSLAAFAHDGTSWTPLTGFRHFRDGREYTSSEPFHETGWHRQFLVEADHTDEWLFDHRADLGTHLARGAQAHTVVEAAVLLNASNEASDSVRLLEAVRVIETLASILHQHWKDVVDTYVTPDHVWRRTRLEAFNALTTLGHDLNLSANLPHLRTTADGLRRWENGQELLDVAEATDRLLSLAPTLPSYSAHARRARDLAASLATPASTAAYLQAQVASEARLIRRVHRVRNSLTHGGPLNPMVTAAAAPVAAQKAKLLTGTCLYGLLNGVAPHQALDNHRQRIDAMLARVVTATTTREGLYGPPPKL